MKACQNLSKLMVHGPRVREPPALLRHSGDILRLTRMPLAAILTRYFDDPLLRNVFAGSGGDLGVPASAFLSILLLCHYLGGAYYPIGGSGAMRDAYVAGLQSSGATLLRNRLVTRIEVLGEHTPEQTLLNRAATLR